MKVILLPTYLYYIQLTLIHEICVLVFVEDREPVTPRPTRRPTPTFDIIVPNREVRAPVRSRVTMECRVSGDARNVNIVWSKLGGELPRGATQRDGVLTLPSVERSAQGRYVCTASVPSGVTRTAYVTLYIEYRTEPTRPPRPGGGRFSKVVWWWDQ